MNPGIDFKDINLSAITPIRDQLCDTKFLENLKSTPSEQELVRILQCIDLTTLQGDDTFPRVERLCKQALSPTSLPNLHVAAVCTFPAFVPLTLELLAKTPVKIATVAAGFPHGLSPMNSRLDEVSCCVELGAHEIDIVIRRMHALEGQWDLLYDEIKQFKERCVDAKLKVILATGELQDPEIIYKASMISMMAGADFIKTSTGKEAVNATLEAGYVMVHAIRDYYNLTKIRVGLKPAGGIRTAKEACQWWTLVEKTLGQEWIHPALFRIGASALVNDIAKQVTTQTPLHETIP